MILNYPNIFLTSLLLFNSSDSFHLPNPSFFHHHRHHANHPTHSRSSRASSTLYASSLSPAESYLQTLNTVITNTNNPYQELQGSQFYTASDYLNTLSTASSILVSESSSQEQDILLPQQQELVLQQTTTTETTPQEFIVNLSNQILADGEDYTTTSTSSTTNMDVPIIASSNTEALDTSTSSMTDLLKSQLSSTNYDYFTGTTTTTTDPASTSESIQNMIPSKLNFASRFDPTTFNYSPPTNLFSIKKSSFSSPPTTTSTNTMMKSLSSSFDQLSNQFTQMGQKYNHALTDTTTNLQSKLHQIQTQSIDSIQNSIANTQNTIHSSSHSTLDSISDASLLDIGNTILSSLIFLGKIFESSLDILLQTFGQPTIHTIISNTQSSIQTMIQDATQSIVSTIESIGDITLKQVLQSIITLFIVICKIILMAMNAIVKVLSGQEASEWMMIATNSISHQVNTVSMKANMFIYDVTHASMKELTLAIVDLSQQVGNELLASVESVGDVVVAVSS